MNLTHSPYFHAETSVRRIMNQVLLALLPGIVVYTVLVGMAVIVQILLACFAALLFEGVFQKLRGRSLASLHDGTALVTAFLIALTFPPLSPWWLTALGVFFAIVIAKQLYGGLGQNPFNPAMIAFAVCIVAFPALMSQWPAQGLHLPFEQQLEVIFGFSPRIDALTAATPLDAIKTALKMEGFTGSIQELLESQSLYGTFAGRGWEWVTTAYLIGGGFLILRRIITWHVPVAFIVSMTAISLLCWFIDPARFSSPLFHLFSGGAMLGAFFIATDPVSGCATPRGKLIFGAGAGLLAYLIRVFGGFPDGIAFSVLIMNICAPLIDVYAQPVIFGAAKKGTRS